MTITHSWVYAVHFRSPLWQNRPNKACLKCFSPSTKSFFDFNDNSRVVKGRWAMHGGMQYDPIQSQCHNPFKVGNLAIFKSYLRHLQWQLATDHWFLNYGTISQFDQAGFLLFVLVFMSRDFELGRNVTCEESWTWLIFAVVVSFSEVVLDFFSAVALLLGRKVVYSLHLWSFMEL